MSVAIAKATPATVTVTVVLAIGPVDGVSTGGGATSAISKLPLGFWRRERCGRDRSARHGFSWSDALLPVGRMVNGRRSGRSLRWRSRPRSSSRMGVWHDRRRLRPRPTFDSIAPVSLDQRLLIGKPLPCLFVWGALSDHERRSKGSRRRADHHLRNTHPRRPRSEGEGERRRRGSEHRRCTRSKCSRCRRRHVRHKEMVRCVGQGLLLRGLDAGRRAGPK